MLKRIGLGLVFLLILLPAHEVGHVLLNLTFGVTVENIYVGVPPMLSIPLRNDYVKNISFGPVLLIAAVEPNAAQNEMLASWKSILINFAGPLVNLLIPLAGAILFIKREKRFSENVAFFFDFSLMLFIFNIAPLPYTDGGNMMLYFFTMIGILPGINEFYVSMNRWILKLFEYGGFFIILLYYVPIMKFFCRFIKYGSWEYGGLLPARKK